VDNLSRIKYGLKLRTSESRLMKDAERLIDKGIFDYAELLIDPKNPDIAPFSEFDLDYVIHCPHENHGVDIGNQEQNDFTLKMLDISQRFADELNANIVILHAGTGSLENAKNVLSSCNDSRITLENMPKVGINGEACLGYTAETMKALVSSRFGICIDFGHAIKASMTLKIDYKKIIQEFLKIKPRIFHISDGNFNTEKDEHLNIGAGAYDFKYFRNCIYNNPSKFVTLETPRQNNMSLEENVKNVEALRSVWEL